MLWFKLGLIATVLGSGMWYVTGAEKAKGERKALMIQVRNLTQESGRKTAEIAGLNERIKANNQRWQDAINAEKLRVNAAKEAADQVSIERDRIKAALIQSRKNWDEVMKHDQTVRNWAAADTPTAVWDRLRNAAGQ